MAVGLRHHAPVERHVCAAHRLALWQYARTGLVEEGLTGEIIADGYHLPTSLMKMAYRLRALAVLVSDAMQASGLGPGEYNIGGLSAVVEAGYDVAVLVDRRVRQLGEHHGAVSQHVVRMVGISLLDAVRMATVTPAHHQPARYRPPGLALC